MRTRNELFNDAQNLFGHGFATEIVQNVNPELKQQDIEDVYQKVHEQLRGREEALKAWKTMSLQWLDNLKNAFIAGNLAK